MLNVDVDLSREEAELPEAEMEALPGRGGTLFRSRLESTLGLLWSSVGLPQRQLTSLLTELSSCVNSICELWVHGNVECSQDIYGPGTSIMSAVQLDEQGSGGLRLPSASHEHGAVLANTAFPLADWTNTWARTHCGKIAVD
ncbi:hypothetical protein FQN50_001581 [Emmonsiellopsis sp. PD_5]|nr:hypothetical protein FQN50_001581 [Emmonsiellopsis sp. PD_5]